MISPNLSMALAQAQQQDLRRAAEAARRTAGLSSRKHFTRFGIGRMPWTRATRRGRQTGALTVDVIANG
jgi:transposase